MPTSIPLSAQPRLTLRQSARFAWLMLQERHLFRRVERAGRRQRRIGADLGGGRLLYLTRRWLACHAALADLLGVPERADAAAVRALLAGCARKDIRLPCKGSGIEAPTSVQHYSITAA